MHTAMQLELDAKPEMLVLDSRVIVGCASMTRAIALCQQISGVEDKELCGPKGIVNEQAQWSRIKSGQHFFPQDKLGLLMDVCGNEAPLFWLARRRGYLLTPMETETERQLRIERELRIAAEQKLAYAESLLRGR